MKNVTLAMFTVLTLQSFSVAMAARDLTNVVIKPQATFALDGHNFIDAGNVELLNDVTRFTISTWVRPASLDRHQAIFSKYDTCYRLGGQLGGLGLAANPGGSLFFLLSDFSDRRISFTTQTGVLQAEQWSHIAVVFDGNAVDATDKINLYIDGDRMPIDIQSAFPHTRTVSTDVTFKLGTARDSLCQTNHFIGEISEANIIGDALNRGRIRFLRDVTRPIQ